MRVGTDSETFWGLAAILILTVLITSGAIAWKLLALRRREATRLRAIERIKGEGVAK